MGLRVYIFLFLWRFYLCVIFSQLITLLPSYCFGGRVQFHLSIHLFQQMCESPVHSFFWFIVSESCNLGHMDVFLKRNPVGKTEPIKTLRNCSEVYKIVISPLWLLKNPFRWVTDQSQEHGKEKRRAPVIGVTQAPRNSLRCCLVSHFSGCCLGIPTFLLLLLPLLSGILPASPAWLSSITLFYHFLFTYWLSGRLLNSLKAEITCLVCLPGA